MATQCMYLHFTTDPHKPPYLGKHGLLKPLEVTDLTKENWHLYITQQEPSDNNTEKQKVARGSDC